MRQWMSLGLVTVVSLFASISVWAAPSVQADRAAEETAAARLAEAETRAVQAETRAVQAEARAVQAEARAAEVEAGAAAALILVAEAEARAAEAEARAAEAEARAAEAMALAEEIIRSASAASGADSDLPADAEWEEAISRATHYRRPDRTSEENLDDGSHYDQSSDDRSYREPCGGTANRRDISGFSYEIRSNTKSIHWRWKESTGGQWRAYYDGVYLGRVGDRITRVADTEVAWYEYRPARSRREGRFVLLIACNVSGVDEIDIHYHH